MGFFSGIARTVKKAARTAVGGAKNLVKDSKKVVQSTAKTVSNVTTDMAAGHFGDAAHDAVSGTLQNVKDVAGAVGGVLQTANNLRKDARDLEPKFIIDIENQGADALNKFLMSKAGSIFGEILSFIPVVDVFYIAYEAVTFLVMAENLRKEISTLKADADKRMLLSSLQARQYVYDPGMKTIRLSKGAEDAALDQWRYVPGRDGFSKVTPAAAVAGGVGVGGVLALLLLL